MIRSIHAALVLGAALVSTTPVVAQDEVSVQVAYGDLNLRDPAGLQIFRQRLRSAIDQVCGKVDWYDLAYAHAAQDCRREIQASAVRAERVALASAGQAAPVLASRNKPLH